MNKISANQVELAKELIKHIEQAQSLFQKMLDDEDGTLPPYILSRTTPILGIKIKGVQAFTSGGQLLGVKAAISSLITAYNSQQEAERKTPIEVPEPRPTKKKISYNPVEKALKDAERFNK